MANAQQQSNQPGVERSRSAAERPPAARSNRGANDAEALLGRAQERLGDLVSERPWTMVGAAAGVGLALGAVSRTRASNDLVRMVSGTASGMAVRYAFDALAQWFERERSAR